MEYWPQVLTIVISNLGLFLWSRRESRSDWRHMDAKINSFIEAMNKESKSFHTALNEQSKSFHAALNKESKDFHGRLTDLETRRKMERESGS